MKKTTSTDIPHARDQALLKQLMRSLPDLVWIKNSDGVYLACNRFFEDFFGATEEEIVGKTDYDFVDSEKADFYREHDLNAIHQKAPVRNEEWVTFASDGRQMLVETTKMPIYDERGKLLGVLGMAHDITLRKQTEKQLSENIKLFEAILSATIDGFWAVDMQGVLQDVNDAYCHLSGYSREELIGRHLSKIDVHDKPEIVKQRISHILAQGGALFESEHRRKDGSVWPVEISVSYSPVDGGRMFSFIRDITLRKQDELYNNLRNELSEMTYQGEMHELMRKALDRAEQITGSEIGFFHFVDDDQENVSLQVWSTRTLNEMCYAKGESMHYPVSQAGVWVDCIHTGEAVIHNDYSALKHKKGLPKGHAPLVRELTVPIKRNNRIVAIIGVGNKQSFYNDNDLDMVRRIADMAYDFVERKMAEQKIHYMAYNDVLTGLPNRELFADRMQQAIFHANRSKRKLCICYLDLDGFKPVNDHYGHQTGDQLLIELSERLKKEMREIDTIARLGGDEFVLLLTDITTIHQGEEIVERLLKTIVEPFELNKNRVYVSASIGITIYPDDNADADTLVRHADQAMYLAKENGKNTWRLYEPIEDRKSRQQREWLQSFHRAIIKDELVLFYQPRIDLQKGTLAGAEALVRWQHPSEGLLTPDRFLPQIEGTPLEIELDEWVLKTAMKQHMSWRGSGLHLPVSINISPRHIQQRSFAIHLENLLKQFPEDIAAHIELEVLETGALQDIETVIEVMTACRSLGVSFSLDDFGTGYSSLTHFYRLPVSVLKIDQNFVRDMLDNTQDQDIVEGVLRLAQTLRTPVVAEGVENIELGLLLLQQGCEYAQGYGIARPMPAQQITGWADDFRQNSIWYELHNASTKFTPLHDLNVAIFSHQQWLAQIREHLTTSFTTPLPEMDKQSCQFTHWYHGMGSRRFGHKEGYAFLIAQHNKIHDMARKLIDSARTEEMDLTSGKFRALEKASEALTLSLIELSR